MDRPIGTESLLDVRRVLFTVSYGFWPLLMTLHLSLMTRPSHKPSFYSLNTLSSLYLRAFGLALISLSGTCSPRELTWLALSPFISSVQFSSVAQSCLTLCDPRNRSTPGLPVHHQFLEFTQTHVHWVGDAIQPSHPLSSPSSPVPNPSPFILGSNYYLFEHLPWVPRSTSFQPFLSPSLSWFSAWLLLSESVMSIHCVTGSIYLSH